MVDATIVGMNVRRHAAGIKTRAKIIMALASLPDYPTLRAIAAAAGCHWTTVDHHMPVLQDEGQAISDDYGWRLTRTGQATAAYLREFCQGS